MWDKFIAELAKSGNVGNACKIAKTDRATALKRRTEDPEFSELWDNALADHRDSLYQYAWQRAMIGWDETVYYQGVEVDTKRVHSEKMLEFLIRRHDAADPDTDAVDAATVQVVHMENDRDD